jgi:4-hydroxy-tetrahydrodipicolinate synthase
VRQEIPYAFVLEAAFIMVFCRQFHMLSSTLSGVFVPVGTALTRDDKVDIPGVRRIARYLMEAGVHALFANGSMSGFAFLTDDQQMVAIETVIEEAAGRIPVMAGLGETSTSRALPKARAMARAGASYLSVLPPFYFFAQQEHLVAYFSEIASAVDIPIMLYDNPALTKNPIQPETIVELRRRVPNIIGVKESNQDCVNLQRLLTLTAGDPGFSVLTGSEFLVLVGLQMGVRGCVGGLHNICPHLAVELYEAFQRGDLETARQRQDALIDVWQIFTYGKIWGAFDEALRWLGLCERATGAPYATPVSDSDREQIHAILSRHLGGRRPSPAGMKADG